MKYLEKVKGSIQFDLTYVPREHNVQAGLLSKLASMKILGEQRSVIQSTLHRPSIEHDEVFFHIGGTNLLDGFTYYLLGKWTCLD